MLLYGCKLVRADQAEVASVAPSRMNKEGGFEAVTVYVDIDDWAAVRAQAAEVRLPASTLAAAAIKAYLAMPPAQQAKVKDVAAEIRQERRPRKTE